jgi:hypothetical protein
MEGFNYEENIPTMDETPLETYQKFVNLCGRIVTLCKELEERVVGEGEKSYKHGVPKEWYTSHIPE